MKPEPPKQISKKDAKEKNKNTITHTQFKFASFQPFSRVSAPTTHLQALRMH